MKSLLLVVLISFLTTAIGAYNPVPIGSVIISTLSKIFVMIPKEYGGDDKLNIIYTASENMTIINTIYDPTLRYLFILFTNVTNGTVYLSQLQSREQLNSTVYQLPFSFSSSYINKLASFSSDVANRRGFITYEINQTDSVRLFSMSGLMTIPISMPATIRMPIRSVAYATPLNRLFVITNSTVDSCIHLDANNLQCCQAPPQANQLRSIAFDETSSDFAVYVLDELSGIYSVRISDSGCPTALKPINGLENYNNIQLVVDRGLYFAFGSAQNQIENSFLLIANQTENARSISIGLTIVALHISYPDLKTVSNEEETCFHGITYSDYRVAVILAAIFGTIMGIFMCFNALFCIDFFMTKSIIRDLKKQIPHNLLEDRWNRLVEEKYAKIALEKQRQNENPISRRKSSVFDRKSAAVIPVTTATASQFRDPNSTGENPNFLSTTTRPKLSAFLRRKSDNYFTRRRSEDYENQRDASRNESATTQPSFQRPQITTNQNYIGPVEEEQQQQQPPSQERLLTKNLSGHHLIKFDEDFL